MDVIVSHGRPFDVSHSICYGKETVVASHYRKKERKEILQKRHSKVS